MKDMDRMESHKYKNNGETAMRIEAKYGDITDIKCDAIVNAANRTLLGGGGVDGAIHRAAGTGLLKECVTLKGCESGEARLTGGYNLPAAHVIHTVGPVWHGGNNSEADVLRSCYENSLEIAAENHFDTVAFPAISCGIYGYPMDQACRIAVVTVRDFLEQHEYPKKVVFIDLNIDVVDEYRSLLNQ